MMSTSPEQVVSPADPALDVDAMADDYLTFCMSRDRSLERLKPGAAPAVFHVGDIDTSTFLSYVETAPTDVEKCIRAFQCGVRLVENATLRDGSHHATIKPADTTTVGSSTVTRMSLDQVHSFAPIYVQDIGRRAYMRSFFDPRTAADYPLPPGLVSAFVTLLQVAGKTANASESGESSEPREETP